MPAPTWSDATGTGGPMVGWCLLRGARFGAVRRGAFLCRGARVRLVTAALRAELRLRRAGLRLRRAGLR
ncbi:MAG: hypothetical protein M3133_04145, partial [Actinomycetota bacterium]|nr:hypothetical protein [Actinomycetota bacterium]